MLCNVRGNWKCERPYMADFCLSRPAETDPKLPVYNGTCRAWQCLFAETLLRISRSDVLV